MADRKAIVVAISGCSSSGKTTLSRLLRDIFPNTFILHEDDFYKMDKDIPLKNGIADWDCAEAIDIPAMTKAVAYIRQHASIPPTLDSKEDQNSVGKCPVPDSVIAELKAKASAAIPEDHPLRASRLRMCLFDGFLLYSRSMAELAPSLDVKMLLRISHAQAKARREARDGYVTLEGFWKDPPGYVDDIVWPNYVKEHAWLFEDGDVEGRYRQEVLKEEGILVPDGGAMDANMSDTLRWMVEAILNDLQKYK
ncbi:hypothetical protein V2A60_005421 [Cordyceps javanica]|uniref:Nicotinamide riboside kinase 1 n=1 Tax=Cordyceps javanica TaxID=43265 RepID=A0A545VE58_9HYPO|nr:nicotinamide riboside kinase 1 [Cordyceps javanica]TQW10322.1 nicotinamide riboside kinase 1 [Cordyceps javanica]